MQDANFPQQQLYQQPFYPQTQNLNNPVRESNEFEGTGKRIMLGQRPHDYADQDDYSLYDSLNQKSYVSRLVDDKVNLV